MVYLAKHEMTSEKKTNLSQYVTDILAALGSKPAVQTKELNKS